MKNIGFSILLGFVMQASVSAQTNSQAASTNAPPPRAPATIIARSGSSRTWARITSQTNAAGVVSLVTNKAYVEVGSGLCFLQDGQWVDSVAAIQIDNVAGGASATQTPHKVHFAGNANTAGGAIHLVAPDGKVFDSRVYGLAYWDTASGKSILLAPLQDSQGTLVGSNRVVYADAFQGLKADIEYIFTKAGLQQNILLRERPPAPESVAVGLSAASTRLEVLTEFFSPPAPAKKRSQVIKGIQEDTLLNFGGMAIGMGKAFFTPGQNGGKSAGLGRVAKHWTRLDGGRDFLIEEVPYGAISNAVQKLPLHASAAPVGKDIKRLAALEPLLPRDTASARPPEAMKLAQSMPDQDGLVLDYTEFGWGDGTTNVVFQSDTTYLIGNGGLYLCQSATFEGGTVVKFDDGTAIINVGDCNLIFNGSAFRPVVLTSSDDDSVGDTIGGSSGSPSPGTACYIVDDGGAGGATGVTIQHVRFSYAFNAYEDDIDTSHVFEDCQIVQCSDAAFYLPNDTDLYLYNVLLAGCGSLYEDNYAVLHAVNITADSFSGFGVYGFSGGDIINSILTACDNSIYNFTLDSTCVVADSGDGIYQTVGDGNYYLAPGTYQGMGTTAIDPWLLGDLAAKTTCPPVVYSSATISVDTTLGIAAPRDTCNPGPDLGYHYDPMDYVFGGATVTSNLTFTPGTVVGWFSGGYAQPYGMDIENNATASFQGSATAPVWWVRANTVQESIASTGHNWPGVAWPGVGAAGGLIGQGDTSGDSPQANLFFTRCSILGSGDGGSLHHFADYGGYLTVNAAHSEFYGGMIGGYALSCVFTNCLMDRMGGGQFKGFPGNVYMMTNCTWHGGWLSLTPTNPAFPLVVRDTSFDGTAIYIYAPGGHTNCDYNAFTNTSDEYPIGGNHDVIVTNGFNWQGSWFGNYYLPSDSPLILAGDVTADVVGLYHFTTQTSQVPEGDSQVDIGYHYVATDGNGNPLDSNSDGTPDYLEDANGNGVVDAGEAAWITYAADSNGSIGLQVYTPMQ